MDDKAWGCRDGVEISVGMYYAAGRRLVQIYIDDEAAHDCLGATLTPDQAEELAAELVRLVAEARVKA